MKSKLGVIILLCMFVIVAATACSNEDDSASEGGVTINWWSMFHENEAQAEVYQRAIARYEAATGNTVNVTWMGRDVRLTLRTAIDSGEPIDIIENSPDWLYPTFGTEALLPLDDYLDMVFPTTGGQTFGETIISSYLDFARTYADSGRVYFIPQQPAVAAMFYNRAIFREAGITSQPTTWAEFLDVAQRLSDAGYDVATIDNAYRFSLFGAYLAMLGGQEFAYAVDADESGEMWGDPAVLQIAQAFEEMASRGFLSSTAPANIWPAGQQEFAIGLTAIYLINGSWFPSEVAETAGPDFEWGAMGFPALPGSADPNTTIQFISQGFAISANSEHPDEAAELIAFLLDVETQQDMVDTASAIPATYGVNWPSELAGIQAMLNNMTGSHTIWGGMSTPDVTAALSTNLGLLFAGNINADEFVANMIADTRRN